MATATSTDLSKYIKGVNDIKDCYDTKDIAYVGENNIDKPIMSEDEFRKFVENYYITPIPLIDFLSGGADYITNFLESDKYKYQLNTKGKSIVNIKDNEALLILMKEFNNKIKFTSKNGFKEIDCNAKVSDILLEQELYNKLAKRVNASGILNKGKKKYFKEIVDKNWEDCIKSPKLLSQNGLTVLHIPTKDKVVENSWKGVQEAVNSGNIYGMPAMRINMNGILIGGTEFLPKTAPKLSNDVSKILKSLLSNLKSKGIDLDDSDLKSLNGKLKAFSEMEQGLLDDAVILAGFNKSATAPDFNESGSVKLPEMERLNREYESKMGRYTKMQRNFQDVIFAILQNCA